MRWRSISDKEGKVKLKKPIVIGLTGGIASGKTVVMNELTELGAMAIEADKISRGIYLKGKPAYKKILKTFSESVLGPDREIDRKKLGEIVFENPLKRRKLEKITHPEIMKEIKSQINKLSRENRLIIVDAPLLFEAKIQKMFEKTILVWASEDIQLTRLVQRDNITLEEAKKRISSQIPIEKKKKMADFVIDNSGLMLETLAKAKLLYMNLFLKYSLKK